MRIRRHRHSTPLRKRLFCRSLEERRVPATFTVINLSDNGPGSLRTAIAGANGLGGADDIVFQPGVVGVITLTTGQLNINDDLTILGPGIVVSGNNMSRVFDTTGAATGANITLVSLAIVNGKVADDGGAIRTADEDLSVIGCTIAGNRVSGVNSDGGGIAVLAAPGTLSLISSTVDNNHSDNRHGGGIDLGSGVAATITNCVISDNTAFDAGGGIHVVSGSLTMVNSTLAANSGKRGGGLNFFGTVGAGGLFIRNSTLSGNTSVETGGAIELLSFAGTLTVQNSTITANSAGVSGGGGIGRVSGTGIIDLESAIVSANTDTAAANDDLFTTGTVNAKFSAIRTKTGVTTFVPDAVTTALLGLNLKLGPLASNGGSGGQSHVPAPDSPVINQGSNPAGLTTDQRGSPAERVANGTADIGAIELQVFLVTNTNDSGSGSLRSAIINANNFVGFDTVGFDPSVFSSLKSIKLTTGVLTLEESVTIAGPASRVTIDGNANDRIINVFDTAPIGSSIVLQNLNLTNANGVTSGGAILASQVALTIQNCAITNSIAGIGGGAVFIRASAGSLVIEDSVIAGNQAGTVGGGIDSVLGAPVTVRRSTLSGNSAIEGGGIYIIGADLTIEQSTLSGNTATMASATTGGGAIYFTGTTQKLSVINSTLSGNTAPSACGGAVLLRGIAGNAVPGVFQNCTMTANSAGTSGGGIAGFTTAVTLTSTIVAGNSNASGPDMFFSAATNVTSNQSLIGVIDAGNFFLIGSGNQTGSKAAPINAKLSPLQNNLGPTLTHALLAGSPAIDQGSNPLGLVTDQRGGGFARVAGAKIDIGAVEVNQSLVVTNTNDSGLGSLRQAVLNANIQPGAETVTFDPATFASAKTIKLSTGELAITQPITIAGPTVPVTIDGNAKGRIFNLGFSATAAPIVLQRLALTNGQVTGFGGAILMDDESVTLQACSITNSSATSDGGGVSLGSGTIVVEDCAISGNSAGNDGGAISGDGGSMTIRRSTLSGNTADSGGAVYLIGQSLAIDDSTLSGNSASSIFGGGAIYAASTFSSFVVKNSTLSANTAAIGRGGAVALSNFGGNAIFPNSTVTGNFALIDGGGIARFSGAGTVTLSSTIVAGNTNANTPDLFFNSATNVGGNSNLVGVNGVGNFTLTGLANLTGTKAAPLNAKLGSLANNGGPTLTHALLSGSPAINQGNNIGGLSTDQRGNGFQRTIGTGTDIGAYEEQSIQLPAKVGSVQVNGGATQRSQVTTIAITFDQIVTLPGAPASAFDLVRLSDNLHPNLSASVNNTGPGTVVTLTFLAGAAVDFGSLADGLYSLTILKSQVNGGNFDSVGTDIPGDNYVEVGNTNSSPKLFRLFGDADGNGVVSAADFNAFRLAYGILGPSIFDFDANNQVTAADFNHFRLRYGISLMP